MELWANNAVSTLTADISSGATSVTVQTGEGARFPNPTAPDFFHVTLTQAGSESLWEIAKCTARASDVLTVVRAQQGTAALAWSKNDKVQLRLTRDGIDNLLQADEAGAMASFRHAGGSGLEAWYSQTTAGDSYGTAAPSANVLRAFPFIAPARGGTLDRLAFAVTSGVAGNARIGLYENTSDLNLYPAARLEGSGDLNTGTTQILTFTISRTLKPGKLYWLAFVSDAAATLRSVLAGTLPTILGVSSALDGTRHFGLSVAFTYAALPTPFPASAAFITAAPFPGLFYRFSA